MMDLETLHMLVDETQIANPGKEFSVQLVDSATGKTREVTALYVDDRQGTFTLEFNGG